MPIIEISALTVKYARRKLAALNQLSLQVPKGETVLLLGPSGSGKSTLALTLNGLLPQSVGELREGTVRVVGLDTQQHSVADLAQRVGILFQDPDAQFATLKVEDEIVFGLENLGYEPQSMDARIDQALSDVGVAALRDRPVSALSGGEKQRVALASLLAMQPEVLIFDEPTANLDSMGTQQVFALLAELKSRGKHTLILIEHKLDELMHLIDRVVVLNTQGGILADGAPREIFDDFGPALQEMGVWMPQVSMLAHEIRRQGVELPLFPITLGDAVRAFRSWVAEAQPRSTQPAASHAQAVPAMQIKNLSFTYGHLPALQDISIDINKGDFLAIVGANGAGKTTLAKHLMGILRPPVGTIALEGKEFTDIPAKDVARKIGYVFQNPEHQFVTETVWDEVAYGLRVMQEDDESVTRKTQELLETFGLARYAKANPFTLSYGEKRRLSVASMLALGQDILILDEPTFGQDERNATALLEILRGLNQQGKTVIVVTHDMRLVLENANRVVAMSAGNVLFDGAPADLAGKAELLSEARLTLPPLARLSALLATEYPHLRSVLTLDNYLGLAR
ncbi:MAG TPA: ABC transporter ATP-binding protein [Anaerolineales bacterium]|nr:ABC transporter ATP-binding protein [Anaerolineales bacterium]HRQ92681.1 ABC transporter ATP-binding protein [Anaerolineales bacterium]